MAKDCRQTNSRPLQNEVVVRLHAAALNHRDLNILVKASEPDVPSFTFGSDGSGVISEIGEGVTEWSVGDEVIFNTVVWCGHCAACMQDHHPNCEKSALLGGTSWDGTFAQFIRLPAKNLIKKPLHLTHTEAASLPLTLGTAWRAVITKLRV